MKKFRWLFRFLIAVGAIALVVALAIPNFVKARSSCGSGSLCEITLKHIEGAKKIWELEHRATLRDVVLPSDLYGTDKYIREEPNCNMGGTYAIGKLREKPTCSIGTPGHILGYVPPAPKPGLVDRMVQFFRD